MVVKIESLQVQQVLPYYFVFFETLIKQSGKTDQLCFNNMFG